MALSDSVPAVHDLLASSLGLLPPAGLCSNPSLAFRDSEGSRAPAVDLESDVLTQAIQALTLTPDDPKVDASAAQEPLPLHGPAEANDWILYDRVINPGDGVGGINLAKAPARASRLSTFAAFQEAGSESPCHYVGPTLLKALGDQAAAKAFEAAELPEKPFGAYDCFGEPGRIFISTLEVHQHRPPVPELAHFKTLQWQLNAPPVRYGGNSPPFAPASNSAPRSPVSEVPSELENEATDIIIGYLSDPAINPYKGSVPLERIQNIFRGKHGDLYQQVVGSKHSAWKKFIQRNSDKFSQFSVEEGKWRMRLLCHTDWQEGDRREEAARVAWETHFTNVLVAYLETMVDLCSSLDAFMAAYPTMPQSQETDANGKPYALPHRGDLVRFIRRSSRFSYDQGSYMISFRREVLDLVRDSSGLVKQGSDPLERSRSDTKEPRKERPSVPKEEPLSSPNSKGVPYFGVQASPAVFLPADELKEPFAEQMLPGYFVPGQFVPFYHTPFFPPPMVPYPMSLPGGFMPPAGPSADSLTPAAADAPSAEKEQQATKLIEEYLQDPTINPYQGSVPVERIQNLFRSRHSALYEEVVGSKHSAWKRFIERNANVFSIFSVDEGKWRMRLLYHADWEAGDRKEEDARSAWEAHFTAVLAAYLASREGRTSTLDEFMAAYPALVDPADRDKSQYTLPHRGDLVRFLRRSTAFTYDQGSFLIAFRKERDGSPGAPAAAPEKKLSPKATPKVGETKLNPFAPCFRPKSDVSLTHG
eukprot:EG_transcript_707